MGCRPGPRSSLSLPFHNSLARGCSRSTRRKNPKGPRSTFAAAHHAASKKIACGGGPPRWLGPEGSLCVSAKAEPQARVSSRWEPQQEIHNPDALFQPSFLHQRVRQHVYSASIAQLKLPAASPLPWAPALRGVWVNDVQLQSASSLTLKPCLPGEPLLNFNNPAPGGLG